MKKISLCLITLAFAACSGGSTLKTPADVILTATGVVWNGTGLATTITARAVDAEGEPVHKALLELSHDGQGLSVDPVLATTDVNGEAVFAVTTSNDGPVAFQTRLPDSLTDMGDPLTVDLSLTLTLSAGAVELTHPGGRVSISAFVADADGPLPGLELALVSDRAGDVITPASQQSDVAGEATFEMSSDETGPVMFSLSVPALDPGAGPSVALAFSGPSLSGNWSQPQPGAVIQNPRIGALTLALGSDPFDQAVFSELTSQSLAEVPALGASGQFSLTLPLNPPAEQLYDPDPTNPDLPESFVIGSYLIAIYDDLDDSADYSAGDQVIALSDVPPLLAWAEGEMPAPDVVPGLVAGYQFMDPFDNDPPLIYPLADLADQHDLDIRMANCPSTAIAGQIRFGNTLPADADVHVAILLIDAGLIFSGQAEQMFNSGNYYIMSDMQVAYVADTVVDYQLDLPVPGDVHADYADFLIAWGPTMPDVGILAPLVYVDSDDNGVFTNDDNDLSTGDLLVGGVDLPFGYGYTLLEWVDDPLSLFFGLFAPGLNQGYNLVLEPLSRQVVSVIDDNTLELDDDLPGGETGLPFRVQREVQGGDPLVLIEGGDLATSQAQTTRVSSATGGFSGLIQAGDELVITVELEDSQILDFDTPVNLMTR